MKKIIRNIGVAATSLFLVALLNVNAYSQNSDISKTSDAWLRAAIASLNEENLRLNFETAYGKACANILIKAHIQMLPYPDLPVENIPAADKEKYERLFSQLQNLRNNPPTWKTIVGDEEKKLLQEFSPPTPPVFAGDKKAEQKDSQKNKSLNRFSSHQGEVKTIESSSAESDAKNQAEPIEEKK